MQVPSAHINRFITVVLYKSITVGYLEVNSVNLHTCTVMYKNYIELLGEIQGKVQGGSEQYIPHSDNVWWGEAWRIWQKNTICLTKEHPDFCTSNTFIFHTSKLYPSSTHFH